MARPATVPTGPSSCSGETAAEPTETVPGQSQGPADRRLGPLERPVAARTVDLTSINHFPRQSASNVAEDRDVISAVTAKPIKINTQGSRA